MKKTLLLLLTFVCSTGMMHAVSNNTVEIVYNGTTATVTIASNISSYVTLKSGTSSHVVLVQDSTFAGVDATASNTSGEIIYALSGTSTNGSFYMEGSYKATVNLNGVTLTNPSGPAIAIMDGKRIEVSIKSGTTNTLTDGENTDYNGCYHCKGHTKFKGKGTLNVAGNSRHGIYSKEYIEVKNCSINITSAVKDAIHCKEYFLQESGAINISGATDDGIQVELSGTSSTGVTEEHEDEDTGNFYMEAGTLTINGVGGNAIKADGTITYNGGTQNFNTSNTEIHAGINSLTTDSEDMSRYDILGRKLSGTNPHKGLVITHINGKTFKLFQK